MANSRCRMKEKCAHPVTSGGLEAYLDFSRLLNAPTSRSSRRRLSACLRRLSPSAILCRSIRKKPVSLHARKSLSDSAGSSASSLPYESLERSQVGTLSGKGG